MRAVESLEAGVARPMAVTGEPVGPSLGFTLLRAGQRGPGGGGQVAGQEGRRSGQPTASPDTWAWSESPLLQME